MLGNITRALESKSRMRVGGGSFPMEHQLEEVENLVEKIKDIMVDILLNLK